MTVASIKRNGPMADLAVERSLLSIEHHEFDLLRTLIHRQTGIWLRDGKEIMLASRLARRLRHHGMTNYGDYYHYVEDGRNGTELGELINCVTTNKTSFFREAHHFEFLSQTVVPEMMAHDHSAAGPSERRSFSVWSAACSTGEEPYSIAICLLESQLGSRASWDLRVVASDIDTRVLQTAVRAVYPQTELQDIDPDLQKKYFLRGKNDMAGQIKVKKNVTSLVQFQRINLMNHLYPLGGTFDAVFFRNALIYFKQETQDLFLRRIIRYLKPGGYLFLGHSEHITWLHDLLEPLQKTVYRLRSAR